MIRWDAHLCLPQHPQASFEPLVRLHAAGVNYVSINVGADMNPLSQVMAVIAGYRASIAARPELFVLAQRMADVDAAVASNRLAISFDLEGAAPLLDMPEMMELYAQLGVRQLHMAYNRNNSVADGCHDVMRGLTPLGHRMVAAANAAGVLLDCSHTGRACSLEIMAASSKPVVFSHANPLALAEHKRNISDEQIRACAATGGVVCISGLSWFLGSAAPCAADVARHAAYVAQVAGVEHVGIGLDICISEAALDDSPPGDFDPSYWWPAPDYDIANPPSFVGVEVWRELPAALLSAGFGERDLGLVLGANMARVARQVWR